MATSLKKQPKKKLSKRQQEARERNDAEYKRGYDAGFSYIDMWGVPALYEHTRLDIRTLYAYEPTRLGIRNLRGHYRRGFVDGWNDTLEVMRLD